MAGRINRRGWIVLESIASHDGGLCVDFFEHPHGWFGFELFRSDSDGQAGWIVVGGFGGTAFDSAIEAANTAVSAVPFLVDERRSAEAVAAWIAHLRTEREK